MPATRYIVVITAEDGAEEAFGPYGHEKADRIFHQCMEVSSRYGGAGGDFGVSMIPVEHWPGIQAFKEEAL